MSTYYVAGIPYSTNYYDELYHHGIKGQKWGVRRFQNEDGTLTDAGISRYRTDSRRHIQKSLNALDQDIATESVYKRRADKKLARLEKKASKKAERGDSVSEHMQNKMSNLKKESEKRKNTISDYKAITDDIISKAESSGLNVSSKAMYRSVVTGKQAAVGIVASAASVALSPYTGGWAVIGTPVSKVLGTKYKVRQNRL